MNFGFSEEQDLLRQEVRRFIAERCPIPEVRRIQETPTGHAPALWAELGRLGWLGLIVPEAYGGAGLTWIDLLVVLEEAGRSLLPAPLIPTNLAVAAILESGTEAQKEALLPGLAEGTLIGSVALAEESDTLDPADIVLQGKRDGDGWILTGQKRLVQDPEIADLFVVSFRHGDGPGDVGLAIVDASSEGVHASQHPIIDETKRLGNLTLDEVRVPGDRILGQSGSAAELITLLLDQAAVAVTAEMSGAVDEAIRITVAYANERVQFGHPIGHFQGVKHPLAEMYADLESFRSVLYYAAWTIGARREELPRFASLAKAYATETFVRVGLDCVQLHGAIGFTVDCDIQLYFKRSKWARPMFGDANTHYERAIALRGL
jgi:alkylation response protein AidB-like acyl-CoA dehydrogenase